jgi:hypothetical protein
LIMDDEWVVPDDDEYDDDDEYGPPRTHPAWGLV